MIESVGACCCFWVGRAERRARRAGGRGCSLGLVVVVVGEVGSAARSVSVVVIRVA